MEKKRKTKELLEQSPAEIQQEDTQKIAKSGKEEPDTEETESLQWKIYTLESGGSVSVVYKLQSL